MQGTAADGSADGDRRDGANEADSMPGEALRSLVRAYKRRASMVRDVLDAPASDLAVRFQLSASENQPVRSSLTTGRDVPRLVVLVRPFMADDSSLELTAVWSAILATGAVDEQARARIEREFEAVDRLSASFVVDGRARTAREIYRVYAEGEYFTGDPDAKRRLDAMAPGPAAGLLASLFHEICGASARLLLAILDVILGVERSGAIPEAAAPSDPQCIYCGTRVGDFRSDEHVIPESLGGDEIVLRDAVCRECNNRLSVLDQVLLDFEPVALLRAVFGPLTKKGKFAQARFRDVDVQKVAPREIVFNEKGSRPSMTWEEAPDGTFKGSMTVTGRRPFDPVLLARALFKVGLGLVAHDAGGDVALGSRYDRARAFIAGSATMPNHLLLAKMAAPGGSITTWWVPSDDATPVVLEIFGVSLVFNLDATALPAIEEFPDELVTRYWLGDDAGAPEPAKADE